MEDLKQQFKEKTKEFLEQEKIYKDARNKRNEIAEELCEIDDKICKNGGNEPLAFTEDYISEFKKACWKAMNEFSDKEWKDESIEKYTLTYDYFARLYADEVKVEMRVINALYFRSGEDIKVFVEKYGDILKQYGFIA